MAESELERGGSVYCYGPLIHNPDEMKKLEAKGLKILATNNTNSTNNENRNSEGTLLIRAHGVSPALEAGLRGQGFRIADATCPKVKANQLKAAEYYQAGRQVFIAGERGHAEIVGLLGYAPDAVVVGSKEELTANHANHANNTVVIKKPVLIAQTTFSTEEFDRIAQGLQACYPDLEIVNTICPATQERQNALRELCPQVEALLIAGGKSSANTQRLLDIARSSGKPAWVVENANELVESGLKMTLSGYTNIGLSAGASTPEWVTDAIEEELSR
jgi:4-hydroxy-3-methylbut-2-enyl diphosphate reductase